MKWSDYKDVANYSLWKKVYKRKVAELEGKCDRCPWHNGENLERVWQRIPWKMLRGHQYYKGVSEQNVFNNYEKHSWGYEATRRSYGS